MDSGETMSRARYDEQMKEMAARAFENHVIRDKKLKGRWVIAQYKEGGWSNIYWAEVIVTYEGAVLVHGDISLVLFQRFGGFSDVSEPLVWVGRHHDVDYYLKQKATMGFGGSGPRNLAEKFDAPVARCDIKALIEDREREINDEYGVDEDDHWLDEEEKVEARENLKARLKDDEYIAAYLKAIASIEHMGCPDMMFRELYDDLLKAGDYDAGETISNIGIVTAPRVYYAHAAVRKLCQLLGLVEEDKPKAEAVS